jgi:hypothetical protein
MIKLTRASNSKTPVYIVAPNITDVTVCDDGLTTTKGATVVRLVNGQWYAVTESPEEINKLMKGKA